jgi:hypothetical protein
MDPLLASLTTKPLERWTEATAIALAFGWPRSEQLKQWFDHARDKELKVRWEAFWPVAFAIGKVSGLAERWADLDLPRDHDFASSFRDATGVLLQRVTWDTEAASWLFNEVARPQSETRSVTALSLLLRSGNRPEGFDQWLHERDALMGGGHAPPVFGYDFSVGQMECEARLINSSFQVPRQSHA